MIIFAANCMEAFKESLLVLWSVPLYAVVILAEILYSHFHNIKLYIVKGTIHNIILSSLNAGLDILMRGVCLMVLDYFYSFHFFEIKSSFWYWFWLVIGQDFMFYWLHRVDHYCRFFWAIHATHHNSEEFNLTVGFRSSVFQPLYRFIYYIPLTLFGFKGIDIMLVYSATQIFGILVHTQTVGRLGFLEYIFVTPSHHRVHHGKNVPYLDRNMGMLLIIWDKLFGTFEEETEKVEYGLTKPLEKDDVFTLIFHEWIEMWKDVKKAPTLKDKIMYIFGPPGWSHDGSKKTSAQLRKERLLQNSKEKVSN
jgi:sterol desaturase/sphingolipid hydroxylase (fatty acid hydroxylase superfamily)